VVDVNGYYTHSAILQANEVGCAGLLLMPHQVGHPAPPQHVFCTVCSPKGRKSPTDANSPKRPMPIPVDRAAFAAIECRSGASAVEPALGIVSIRQLDRGARRALYAIHTGAAGAQKHKNKAALRRLHDADLVSEADPAKATLTARGVAIAAAAHWGEELGGQVQFGLFDQPARGAEPEPAPAAPAVEARPWARWCGGKGDLLDGIIPALPAEYGRLFVPFVGGAALPLKLARPGMYLSDANTHLVNAYVCIRDSVDDVIAALQEHRSDDVYYYPLRTSFNEGYGDPIWRAAAFIYMNRVCFNGVCRYNRKGEFNVPWGKNFNATICDAENLRAISSVMRSAEIEAADFRAVEEKAQPGDLIYLDPVYIEESKDSFTSYWGKWGDEEHEACASLFRRLASRGVHVLASNSDTPKARELYAGFEIRTLYRSNSVNSKASARGGKPEILVLGGTWTPRGAS
jgi:DNA adenine methylase